MALKWLKALFRKVEIKEYNIPVPELFDWFLNQSEPMLNDIKSHLSRKLTRLHEEIALVRDKLVLLNEAQLQNENIPEKARQVMESNRQNYVRYVQSFLTQIDAPEQPHVDDVSDFISRFEEKLAALKKVTAKSYYVLKEFFARELADVGKHVNNADLLVRDLHSPQYKRIMHIKKDIINLENFLKNKQSSSGMFTQEKKSANVLQNMIDDVKQEISMLKHSKAYKSLETLEQQKEKLLTKIKHNENVLAGEFSAFSRALKKYAHVSLDGKEIIQSYLDNPFSALMNDKEFKILLVLQQLKHAVHSGQILLKDKEKARTLDKINVVSKSHLENLLDIHAKLREQMQGIKKQMLLNNVLREIEELKYKQKHLEDKYERAQKKISKMEKSTPKLDVDDIVSRLEDNINALIDLPINIIIEEKKEQEKEALPEEMSEEIEIRT